MFTMVTIPRPLTHASTNDPALKYMINKQQKSLIFEPHRPKIQIESKVLHRYLKLYRLGPLNVGLF